MRAMLLLVLLVGAAGCTAQNPDFDPASFAAWVATHDPQTGQPWPDASTSRPDLALPAGTRGAGCSDNTDCTHVDAGVCIAPHGDVAYCCQWDYSAHHWNCG